MYLSFEGTSMDDRFYRDRARILQELADEADQVIKRRLLRLANNYDGMTTTRTTRGQAKNKSKQDATFDYRGSNER
jgi:hypothetical protein